MAMLFCCTQRHQYKAGLSLEQMLTREAVVEFMLDPVLFPVRFSENVYISHDTVGRVPLPCAI